VRCRALPTQVTAVASRALEGHALMQSQPKPKPATADQAREEARRALQVSMDRRQ